MKTSAIIACLMFALFYVADSAADCTTSPQVPDANAVLNGNTVCAARGTDRWQEQHHPGGALVDYALGPNSPVDKTKPVGTWSGSGSVVTYIYSGDGGTYSYTVRDNGGGSYSFCGTGGTTDSIDVTVVTGLTSCP